MITIISSTDRLQSKTLQVAQQTFSYLQEMTNQKTFFLDLSLIDFNELNSPSYQSDNTYVNSIRQEYLIPSLQFVFIIPEYNGSFPGILKYFIDIISTVDFKPTFLNKSALLLGVSEGRAGNLRGLTHFASILMHMGLMVIPKSLPISSISNNINDEGNLSIQTEKSIRNCLSILNL